MKTKSAIKVTYEVRRVRRGFWTYDIYEEGRPPQYSVGENYSRREAESKAKRAVAEIQAEKSDV